MPHRNELDLGRRFVLAFGDQKMPDAYDTDADYFRRRGAYGLFKDSLQRRGVLQRWYDPESRATEEALRTWCEQALRAEDREGAEP